MKDLNLKLKKKAPLLDAESWWTVYSLVRGSMGPLSLLLNPFKWLRGLP